MGAAGSQGGSAIYNTNRLSIEALANDVIVVDEKAAQARCLIKIGLHIQII
jgi:hypothetical protein